VRSGGPGQVRMNDYRRQMISMRAAIRFFYFGSYLVFRLGEAVIRLLPLDYAFMVGAGGGDLAYRILRRRRAIALANLRLAFGHEMSEAQLRALNREHFQLLGANLLAGLKASTLPHERIWERVRAKVPDERGQTGWIALISHIGNWELYSHLGEKFPEYRFGALYQPQANPFIDRYLQAMRTKSGIALFDRRKELLSCVRFLREGGVVGVLVDQGAGYAGLWTPLFGRLTSSSTLAARLSLRTGVPVVPIAINTCGRARWKMTISEPVYPKGHDAELLTAQINGLLEEQIRRSPADWLWAHNRWKPLRPHFLFTRDQRRVFFSPDFDRSTLDSFRILIVSPASAEQAAATFPAVRAIKQGRPDTWLTVLTAATLAEGWKGNHSIDCVLEWHRGESVLSLASKIRNAARFDVAIFFATSWKTSLAVWRADIPLRVGRRSGANSWLYNQHPAEPNQPLDSVQLNLHIAQSVGANINELLL
jgi:lauroyl/myristoyl acyltransferase